MSGQWQGSPRRAELPPDWASIRRVVIERAGGRCEATMRDGTRCRDKATDADHKIRGGPDDPTNLQALCAWHHKRKTQAEAADARQPRSNRHPRESHPR